MGPANIAVPGVREDAGPETRAPHWRMRFFHAAWIVGVFINAVIFFSELPLNYQKFL